MRGPSHREGHGRTRRALTRLHSLTAAYAAVLGVSGCAAVDEEAAGRLIVEDSAGVAIIRNVGGGAWGSDAVTVEAVLRIGTEGDERYEFDNVTAVVVSRNGTVFVGTRAEETVRVFDASGLFLLAFARRGRGPGEVSSVQRLSLLGDTAVSVAWTYDGRSPVFTFEGGLLHDAAGRGEFDPATIVAADARGWIEMKPASDMPGRDQQFQPGDTWRQRVHLYYFDPGTEEARETIGTIDLLDLKWDPVRNEFISPLFSSPVELGFDGVGRLCLVRPPAYRVECHTGGRLSSIVTRDISPRLAGDDVLERMREHIRSRDWVSTWPGSGPAMDLRDRDIRSLEWQWQVAGERMLSVVRQILVGESGAFWLERADSIDPLILHQHRSAQMDPRNEGSRWDMFDDDGRFLATVNLPNRFVPMYLRGMDVTGVQRDELDIERIVTYRVER